MLLCQGSVSASLSLPIIFRRSSYSAARLSNLSSWELQVSSVAAKSSPAPPAATESCGAADTSLKKDPSEGSAALKPGVALVVVSLWVNRVSWGVLSFVHKMLIVSGYLWAKGVLRSIITKSWAISAAPNREPPLAFLMRAS